MRCGRRGRVEDMLGRIFEKPFIVFIAVGVAQAPLLWVLACAVPLAIAMEWRARR